MNQQGIAYRELGKAWENACSIFNELGGDVGPTQPVQVFVADQSRPPRPDRYAILVKPVVFEVPERAKNPLDLIFIVAKGRLGISATDPRLLKTLDFSTEVAYFRRKDDDDKNSMKLDHVYGAHFDYAPDQHGHPKFHAQMNDLDNLKSVLAAKYRVPTDDGSNYMTAILRNARLPSAQMDIFSFMLQVAADHLIHKDSTASDMAKLKDLTAEVAKLKGLADLIPAVTANQCTRSVHWY